MKCILHIGTEKTGTTVLQNWLYDNKEKLSQVGIYLSDSIGVTNNRLIPAYFGETLDEFHMDTGITNKQEKKKYFSGFLDNLNGEISNAKIKHHTFIITSEHLHSRLTRAEEIQSLHAFLSNAFDEISVICYFRDQFDLAVSLYSTALKLHSTENINEFFITEKVGPETYYFNYLNIANNWAGVFERQNCIFRIYDRQRFIDNDIRKDFLSIIANNIDLRNLNMSINSANESLFALQAVAYRRINKIIPYRNSDNQEINPKNLEAKKMIDSIDALKVGKIFSPLGKKIRDSFKTVNENFFAKYFDSATKFSTSDTYNLNNLSIKKGGKPPEA